MSSTAKLTAEQIENLAKEIREFLLEHGFVDKIVELSLIHI